MSIESRLMRGDDPADVAKLFGLQVEDLPKVGSNKAVKKKAAKKKAK